MRREKKNSVSAANQCLCALRDIIVYIESGSDNLKLRYLRRLQCTVTRKDLYI